MCSNDAAEDENEKIGNTTALAGQYEHDGPNDEQLRRGGISYVMSDSIPPGYNVGNSLNKQKKRYLFVL